MQQEFKHKSLRFQNVTSKEYNRRNIRFVSINLCVKNYNAYGQVGMMKTFLAEINFVYTQSDDNNNNDSDSKNKNDLI